METLPLISILVIMFATMLVFETIRLKKDLRKLTKLVKYMQKDLDKLKANPQEK